MSPLAWARNGTFQFEFLLRDGQWVEVPIEVPELRLNGRMDVLDRSGKEVKITDIKSGSIEDEKGEIVERVIRQIRLYGLMANWLTCLSSVFLISPKLAADPTGGMPAGTLRGSI